MTKEEQSKHRKDKGTVRATERDLAVLGWIAEMYAARGDQIQRLLSRYPDETRPFKSGGTIAATTTRDQISRWVRAGWIEYERVLAKGPGWAWATRAGLEQVELSYTVRPPSATRLKHIYAVNRVRLSLDKKYIWESERSIRSELEAAQKGKSSGPIPDGVILHPTQGRVAIEVQLTLLKSSEMQKKVIRLLRADSVTEPGPLYPFIWFYVPNETLKKSIEAAREGLQAKEMERIAIVMGDITN